MYPLPMRSPPAGRTSKERRVFRVRVRVRVRVRARGRAHLEGEARHEYEAVARRHGDDQHVLVRLAHLGRG